MAAVAVTPSPARAGQALTFAATAFAVTHAITLSVTGPDGGFVITDQATTDGSGNFTWTAEVASSDTGILSYTVSDGTTSVSGTVQIYSST
jgi:hypothetical protein